MKTKLHDLTFLFSAVMIMSDTFTIIMHNSIRFVKLRPQKKTRINKIYKQNSLLHISKSKIVFNVYLIEEYSIIQKLK